MASRRAVASNCLVPLILLVLCAISIPGATLGGQANDRKEEDKKLLRSVRLPRDPSRSPAKGYFHRFVIRTQEGQIFLGAYWHEQGNVGALAIDIFALETTPKGPVGRRAYSGSLDAGVLALKVTDFDGDGRDDFLFVTKTGGMIATTGIIVLRQTPTGFSRVFDYAGSDVLVYREGGEVRIMVKAKSSKKAQEFSWNAAKQTFEVTRTLELLY